MAEVTWYLRSQTRHPDARVSGFDPQMPGSRICMAYLLLTTPLRCQSKLLRTTTRYGQAPRQGRFAASMASIPLDSSAASESGFPVQRCSTLAHVGGCFLLGLGISG